jgi:hypothetical protein
MIAGCGSFPENMCAKLTSSQHTVKLGPGELRRRRNLRYQARKPTAVCASVMLLYRLLFVDEAFPSDDVVLKDKLQIRRH